MHTGLRPEDPQIRKPSFEGVSRACGLNASASACVNKVLGFLSMRALLSIVMATAAALPALAGEYAVLASGFRIYADRHETAGEVVRLYLAEGVTELPAGQVVAFEPEDYVPPPQLPAPAPERTKLLSPNELVTQAALRNGLPPELVHSVAAIESGYRVDAVSPKGAMGIMQLMPETARRLNADPADPRQNAEAGARYLRELLIKYKDDDYQLRKALAGYNAGPAAVDRHNGIPPYPETQNYVRKVLNRLNRKTE